MNRVPARKKLPYSCTIWNESGEGELINGKRPKTYQKTFFKHVWLELHKAKNVQLTGSIASAGISVLIFRISSIASDDLGNIRIYLPPETFKQLTPKEQSKAWTLQEDKDFLAIGHIKEDLIFQDADVGTTSKVYNINAIYPYNGIKNINHWQVMGD